VKLNVWTMLTRKKRQHLKLGSVFSFLIYLPNMSLQMAGWGLINGPKTRNIKKSLLLSFSAKWNDIFLRGSRKNPYLSRVVKSSYKDNQSKSPFPFWSHLATLMDSVPILKLRLARPASYLKSLKQPCLSQGRIILKGRVLQNPKISK